MTASTRQLHQIADVTSGHYERGAGDDDPAGTHRLVFIGSIDTRPGHPLRLDRCPRFTPSKDPKTAKLQTGDLLIPAKGDRQDVALVDMTVADRPLVAASFLHVIRPNTAIVEPAYLAWWLNHPQTQAAIAGFVRGTKIPFLALKAARALKVVVPDRRTQLLVAELAALSMMESEIMRKLRDHRAALNNAIAMQAVTGANAQ